MLIGDVLRRNATDPALRGHVATIYGERRLTHAALNDLANRYGHALQRRGVRPGDRVAVLGRNSDRYVALYFALAKIGAIMVPVNFWYRAPEIAYTLAQSGAVGLVLEDRLAETAAAVLAGENAPAWSVGFSAADNGGELEKEADTASAAEATVSLAEQDPHIILYTSGTTGFPKGAVLSHGAHVLHALALALATGNRPDDVGVVVYPLFHTGGPDCLVLPHFLTGASLVILDGGDAHAILGAVEQHRVTNIFCVPTVWRRILRRLDEAPADVTSVRRCLGSSDTLPPDLLDGILARFDAEVFVTYGLTEAGCILTVCRLTRENRAKIGSVGTPLPLVELRLVDGSGQEVAPGEVGEVTARGPTLMSGYWNMPEQTSEALRDGWLRTGDLARCDEDGFLMIAGRAKDVIISGGENIYPVEVERVLKAHPSIRDAAVIGVPDPEWGESVLAVVVADPDHPASAEEVIAWVRERLAGFKKPRFVEFLDALPVTTATGKVQKGVLRQRFSVAPQESGRARSPDPN
jgi:fatty-acyl-CoA synthase